MSLRNRLTLVFTLLMGGVLLLCSIVVFSNLSIFMIHSLDEDLKDTAQVIIANLPMDPEGKIELQTFAEQSTLKQFFFQMWGTDGKLQISDSPVLTRPLDEMALSSKSVVLETVDSPAAKLRVLSQPIIVDKANYGIFQIAINLRQVTDTQNMLAIVLIVTTLVAAAMSGIFSWLITDRMLKPLEDVVTTASQISKVDDLSRRIPVKNERKDEVGVLIKVMNQTFERLERLFISQQRFLADVSHDLRTPLTVIKGNAEIMRKTGWADAESLDSIDEEVNHLTHMVLDLMLLVQAESGKLSLELKPVRLDQVIEEIVKRMTPLTEGKLNLIWQSMGETWVKGDAYRLKQVFDNLISNAFQYTPRGGSVTIDLSQTLKNVTINVTDTGPGISPQDLPYVFERFFRAEPSRPRSKDSGFGLGLAISSWIIKQHHGEIRVNSKLGAGTTFTVRLHCYNKQK